jgi:hypothetical protein
VKRHPPYVLAKNHSTNERLLLPLAQRVRLIVGRTWQQSVLVMLMILGTALALLLLGVAIFGDATADARTVFLVSMLVLLLLGLLIVRSLRRSTRRLQMQFDDELLKLETAMDRGSASRSAQSRFS